MKNIFTGTGGSFLINLFKKESGCQFYFFKVVAVSSLVLSINIDLGGIDKSPDNIVRKNVLIAAFNIITSRLV
jgi:hypothetical protein